MLTFFLAAGLVVGLALLVGLHYRLGDLPVDVWSLARREREADAPKALDTMKEAVAIKAGAAVIALQRYEDNIAATFRAHVAEAEMRARMSELRAADSVTALQAATALVRELREVLDAASAPRATRLLPPSMPPAGDAEREAMEVTKPSASGLPCAVAEGDDPGEDEKTRVGKRPCIAPPTGCEESRSGSRGGAP